jgi:hypothetical protein
VGGFKNPFVKSILNLNVDYSGSFLFNLKRYRASRKFLANLNLLNRVRPRTLSDFMIEKRQLPYSKVGRFRILRQAFRLYFGAQLGNSKAFYKKFHSKVLHTHKSREDFLIRSFVCKLDFFLYSLRLFDSVLESKKYIKNFGVFVDDTLVHDNNYILKQLQIVSFISEHCMFFKSRFYFYFSNSLLFSSYYKRIFKHFYSRLWLGNNVFNFNFLNNAIVEEFGSFNHAGLTLSKPKFLVGLGNNVPLFLLNNTISGIVENIVGFALGFKRCRWLKRWRSLRVGHPENVERLFGHRVSVSPFLFDSLIQRFQSRIKCFLTREFLFYKYGNSRVKGCARKLRQRLLFGSNTSLRLKSAVRGKGKTGVFGFVSGTQHKNWHDFNQSFYFRRRVRFFGQTRDEFSFKRWCDRKKNKILNNTKLKQSFKFVKFLFFQEFTKGLLRLLSWRLKRTKIFSLLSRLVARSLVAPVHCRNDFGKSIFSLLVFRNRFLLGFSSFLKGFRVEHLLPSIPFLGVKSTKSTKVVLPSFLFINCLTAKINVSGGIKKRRWYDVVLSKSFLNNTQGVRQRVVRRKFGWRAWFFRKSLKLRSSSANFFFDFEKKYLKYTFDIYLNTLNYTPWYERRPFSRSKFVRFFRLHPRFSSIFFPNFLPRFVEPSFKKFEFLIRPVLLSPIDLRLPFQVKKSSRLNLISSLV